MTARSPKPPSAAQTATICTRLGVDPVWVAWAMEGNQALRLPQLKTMLRMAYRERANKLSIHDRVELGRLVEGFQCLVTLEGPVPHHLVEKPTVAPLVVGWKWGHHGWGETRREVLPALATG